MSLPPKLQELVTYLRSPGKKVVLVAEHHDAEDINELYEMLGKMVHICTETRKIGRPVEFYIESQKATVLSQINTPPSSPPVLIQANLMRFFSLAKITPNHPGFDRRQCKPDSPPSCRNGDDQYAGDIRRLLGSTDIVVGFFGIGHIPVLAGLLGEFRPFLINIAGPEILSAAMAQWPDRMPEVPVPNFPALLPVYADPEATMFGMSVSKQWDARASSEPAKPPRITAEQANAMKVSQLKQELTLRKINFQGMNEKSELVNALVKYTGGKRRRKTRKTRKRSRR